VLHSAAWNSLALQVRCPESSRCLSHEAVLVTVPAAANMSTFGSLPYHQDYMSNIVITVYNVNIRPVVSIWPQAISGTTVPNIFAGFCRTVTGIVNA